MSLEGRAIWDLVLQELSWPEIARRLGGTSSPEAVRKAFTRAVRRIADELKHGNSLTIKLIGRDETLDERSDSGMARDKCRQTSSLPT